MTITPAVCAIAFFNFNNDPVFLRYKNLTTPHHSSAIPYSQFSTKKKSSKSTSSELLFQIVQLYKKKNAIGYISEPQFGDIFID